MSRSQGEVRIYQATRGATSNQGDVSGHGNSSKWLLCMEEVASICSGKRQSAISAAYKTVLV